VPLVPGATGALATTAVAGSRPLAPRELANAAAALVKLVARRRTGAIASGEAAAGDSAASATDRLDGSSRPRVTEPSQPAPGIDRQNPYGP
jgi:hypothetical protein